MSEKTERFDGITETAVPQSGGEAPPLAREPWATPRVLAFERFSGTGGPPDMFAMEGTTYGPS